MLCRMLRLEGELCNFAGKFKNLTTMVIQRWQTVWLLVAAVLMGVFCFVPMARVATDLPDPNSVTFLYPIDMPVLFTLNALVGVLLLIAIFLYRNMRRQKMLTLVSMLLIVASIVAEAIVLFTWDGENGSKVKWMGSIFLLVGAFAFAWLAWRGISSDEKLLRAADRLR